MKPSSISRIGVLLFVLFSPVFTKSRCQRWRGKKQRNIWGDFLEDPECSGPDGQKYPRALVNTLVGQMSFESSRTGRTLRDPKEMRETLLQSYRRANGFDQRDRFARNYLSNCSASVERLCPTEYNTTVPMYGISLTTGEPITIVQKFPNLLQQVVYEECLTDECELVKGRCIQTFVPQLFFVVPMGPVTLMGQDYVLVESGCACSPQAAFT